MYVRVDQSIPCSERVEQGTVISQRISKQILNEARPGDFEALDDFGALGDCETLGRSDLKALWDSMRLGDCEALVRF